MEYSKEQGAVDPNEIKQDEALSKEPVESEIRQSVIQEFGLDEEIDEDLISKLISKEIVNHKKLSTAITQKINWRKKATEPEKEVITKKDVSEDDILRKVDERFEQRELESIDLSDELKTEVKNYAKLNGVSIKQAMNSSYITFIKGEHDKKAKSEEASISLTRKTKSVKDYANTSPADFDLSTEDGRKDFGEYKKWLNSN